jgi:rhodanese-related sulfurtransferase
MARLAVACLVLLTVFSVRPAPADDPEVPEKYMSVDEVNALLQQNKPMTFIDVRPKEQFDELHIRGAVSIPLRDLPSRLASVPKQDLLVLY